MSQLADVGDDAARLRLLDAINALGGAFTLGDLVARTGLPPHEAERHVTHIVRDYDCDLDVDEEGRLTYRFGETLVARPDIVAEDTRRRRRETLQRAFMAFFKVWTVVMVVVYFIIYVCLLIAAFVASQQGKNNSSSSSGRRSSGGGTVFLWLRTWNIMYFFGYDRRERRRRRELERQVRDGADPYSLDDRAQPSADGDVRQRRFIKREVLVGHKRRRANADPDKPGVVERTWYFLFGTRGIERTPLEQEKELLTYIRAKKGLITNADIVALLGVTYREADHMATRLVATYEGEMDITDDGISVYRFPNLMVTARAEVEKATPQLGYLWQLRQKEHKLRGHPEFVIPALNGFNLVLAFVTWFYLLPLFQWTGFGIWFGLVGFPGFFSVCFYVVALRRWWRERRVRARYEQDNIRISMYRLLFAERKASIVIPGDEEAIAAAGLGSWGARKLTEHAQAIADDLAGEKVDRADGLVEIRVPRIQEEMNLVRKLRLGADSGKRVGRLVFSTHGATEVVDELAAEFAALEAQTAAAPVDTHEPVLV